MQIYAFSQRIRPDIVFLHSDVPFLIVELKAYDKKKQLLTKSNLAQNLQQMRETAISYSLPVVFGVLTTYKEWVFVRYSLLDEIATSIREHEEIPRISKCTTISKVYQLAS